MSKLESADQRVTCSRHHWLFSVTTEGIAIKCRAGECRTVHTVTWAEIEEKRLKISGGMPVAMAQARKE